ncbi:hypothetical protein BCR32DRAFT_290139 [Anaeromyces robustus]|uniref:VWFA domain-containing protein n=1 Tax=Anaeromyces robustus TaxID=1754192 RepID=A0A1Y1XKK6_9FUNG|nr:hypothetical protein BCR32DRAFT_290139 [Anaeromyces robustus]|eukprot:ORX86290.1 hypothetical protein BCR32DRAFT_290139 [Anaeromyces robustus]
MKHLFIFKFLFLLCVLFTRNSLANLYKESDTLNEIPLDKVIVYSKSKDTLAEVYVQQTYINNSEDTIEAIYKFPLDSEASVQSFEADVDGQTIKAKIYKNNEANKLYEQEVENGNMAFTLTEEYNDVFQVNVGYLKPKQTVHIKLVYVTELNSGNENNKVSFILPNIIAPRYGSNNSTTDSKIIKGNPVYSENVDYTLSVDVELEMSGKINSIESPSHEVNTEISGDKKNKALVTLKSKKVYLDKDFILTIEAEELNTSKVFIEYNEELKSYASLLTLKPNLIQTDKLKVEIIFLIDQSGSMHGWKLDYLKDALNLFLKSMPVDCYFNIVKFGSLFESLFEKSVKYDEESLNKAVEYVKEMDASMGGTEMKDPLEYIYSTEIQEGYNRSIFLLTDGEIWDVEPVIDLVRENSEKQNSVLYTFGIGKSVSHYLVKSIARNGHGMSLFVTEGERLEEKVLLQLKNVLIPFIQDYTISWKEKGTTTIVKEDEFEQTPYKPPFLRLGSRYSIYTISDKPLIPSPIEITYKYNDGTKKSETLIFDNIKELKNGKLIHSLAASNLIKDLQEGTSQYHYSEEYKNRLDNEEEGKKEVPAIIEKIKEKIIDISLKYQIMSKYTTFLCVKENSEEENNATSNDDKISKKPKKVIVPSKGIPMIKDRTNQKIVTYQKRRTFSGDTYITRDVSAEKLLSSDDNSNNQNNQEIHFRENETKFDVSDINLIKMENADPEEKRKSERLLFNNLIKYQNFDGSFKLSDLLTSIIGPIYGEEFSKEWKKELDAIKTNYENVYPAIVDQFDKLIGTSIACIIFTDYLGNLKNEWELVKEKSENWLNQQQRQNPMNDIRQKILISINQKKEHLLNSLKMLQNEDGSFTFTIIKDLILDKYYGKIISEEWYKELKEIESQTLPIQMEQFNKFIGSVLTLNILKNEKFEDEKYKEINQGLIKALEEWINKTEKQNPLLSKFNQDLEGSLQSNKKRKSIMNNYLSDKDKDNNNNDNNDDNNNKDNTLTCYQDILKNRLISGQEASGSFTIYSILGKLQEMEGNQGACQKEYEHYTKWLNEWFTEVNKLAELSDKDNATDEEKKFINELWGTLVALHIQKEITDNIIKIKNDSISDIETFKKEFLYQEDFDKAEKWVKECLNDPKNIPFLSKWWIDPKEPSKSKETTTNTSKEEKTIDKETTTKINKSTTSSHDEL